MSARMRFWHDDAMDDVVNNEHSASDATDRPTAGGVIPKRT